MCVHCGGHPLSLHLHTEPGASTLTATVPQPAPAASASVQSAAAVHTAARGGHPFPPGYGSTTRVTITQITATDAAEASAGQGATAAAEDGDDSAHLATHIAAADITPLPQWAVAPFMGLPLVGASAYPGVGRGPGTMTHHFGMAPQLTPGGASEGTGAGALPGPGPEHMGGAQATLQRILRDVVDLGAGSAAAGAVPSGHSVAAAAAAIEGSSGHGVPAPAAIGLLAKAAGRLLPGLSPARVAELAVALAAARHYDPSFKQALVDHVVGRMQQFTPEQLGAIAWAFGSCGYYDITLMEALAERMRSSAPQWDARSLARVLWAFGRTRYCHEAVVGALTDMVERLKAQLDSASVADVIFAAGQLGWDDERLHGTVMEFAAENMQSFGPEALGKLAAGLAAFPGQVDDSFCEALACRAAELAPAMELTDVVRVLELLAAQRYSGGRDAIEALAVRCVAPELLEHGRHEALSAALASFNRLNHFSPSVVGLAQVASTGVAAGDSA